MCPHTSTAGHQSYGVSNMATAQKFGIDFVGDIPWGTHLCQFYETKSDLIDILVPYFVEGLQSNEACMWVTSEPLHVEEATAALAREVPNLDTFIKSGQLLILPYEEWYLKGGMFDADRVLEGWVEKEREALSRGFDGLRLTGNTFWIERSLWKRFTDYEEAVNNVIGEHRMIAVCTYRLEKCSGSDVIDVLRNHAGTIIKKGAIWSVVEDVVLRKEAEVALQEAHKEVQYRKQGEEQLRAASLYARSLIEASLDPLVTINIDGKITDVNKATEEVAGYSRDELIGSDFSDYFTERDKAHKGYRQVFTEGFVRDYPLAIRHRSGKVTDVLYNATVYRNEAGETQGVFAAARDITDQKRAEEELQRYSTHLEDLVNERTARLEDLAKFPAENPNAVWRLALDGTVLYANSRAEALVKNEHLPLEDARSLSAQAYASGETSTTEMTDGERVYQTTLAPITDKNYVNIYVTDITEQKRAETALQDAQRLAGIGETAAMIGHDLRNPLQGLRYIIDLQKMRFDRTPPEERDASDWKKAAESFDRIGEQIFYMDKIVGDLQDYARSLKPQLERMSLSNLVEDVLAQVPHDRNVWVNTSIDGVHIDADRHLMHRAFSNLILNAVQAMPGGGTLTISGSVSDHAVVIKVRDTGVGIPAEIEEKLFSPLITGKPKGTGLGLAVVKRIVDAHGGTITFKSEKGKGTTFTVTLPASAVD